MILVWFTSQILFGISARWAFDGHWNWAAAGFVMASSHALTALYFKRP